MVGENEFKKQLISPLNEKPMGKSAKKVKKQNQRKISSKNKIKSEKKISKKILKESPSLKLKNESEIAMDFGVKAYKKFGKIIKSIILFGSSVKKTATTGSDIDIIMVIDDVSISWDQKLVAWYRTELGKIMESNPYRKSLHINTIKLSTWWEDLLRGDPVLINILRYGEAIIDFAGFFEPLKFLVINGKVRPSPEAIYSCLQRAPMHISRSKLAELNSIEGLYWAMVDSAHAALIAEGISPPSPEHIPQELKEAFVDKGRLKKDYLKWYDELLNLHKDISHGKIRDLKGVEIDLHQERAEKFLEKMTQLVKDIVG